MQGIDGILNRVEEETRIKSVIAKVDKIVSKKKEYIREYRMEIGELRSEGN